jgi:hypothetical protein
VKECVSLKTAPSGSPPDFLQPVRVEFSLILQLADIVRSLRFHGFAGPWVTAVGGTTGSQPEWAAAFSGGGFSDYFERPFYQKRAAATYLKALGTQYQGLYKCVYSLLWSDALYFYGKNCTVSLAVGSLMSPRRLQDFGYS